MSTSITSLNQRGRIELARVILYYSQYKFEDNKVESISDELKSTLPTGALPVYKDQDVTLYNPTSIARYLSKKFNLYGSNEIQQTISDEIVDSIWDLLLPLVSAQNESDKLKLKLKLFPQFIGAWEKRINESKSKYISEVRVRYAPSPTGLMHLGGLRTALFNYLFAKKSNGTFILRIEDTDQSRYVEGSAKNLEDCLTWAGIPYDEGPSKPGKCGPYTQSQRLDIYKHYAQVLLDKGDAYRCFCTSERLDTARALLKNKNTVTLYDRHCLKLSKEEVERRLANGDSYTVRLKIPSEKSTKFNDIVKGNVNFNNQLIDDQILMKSDGFPTYHLASVVDDHLMGISHIIRGEEWLNSTPKHIILYEALGWEPPIMAHVPLLLNSDKSKLSKRQGDVSVDAYINKGFLPEALINFVALLGWAPQNNDTQEIFTLKELIDKFTLEGINTSGSVVNLERLDWLNVNHIRRLLDDPEQSHRIVDKVRELLTSKSIGLDRLDDTQFLVKAIHCVKDRVHRIDDFEQLLSPLYSDSIDYQSNDAKKMKEKVWKDNSYEIVSNIIKELEKIEENEFESKNIYKTLQSVCVKIYQPLQETPMTEKEISSKTNTLMSNLRYLLLGSPVGGGIPNTIEILGKENSIKRLLIGLEKNK
eukprot:gene8334-10238_t